VGKAFRGYETISWLPTVGMTAHLTARLSPCLSMPVGRWRRHGRGVEFGEIVCHWRHGSAGPFKAGRAQPFDPFGKNRLWIVVRNKANAQSKKGDQGENNRHSEGRH
jgi:hypothetical protein